MTTSLPIRQPCPPGACICEREPLLETPGADLRILSLTRSEEKRLIERLENLQSLSDLERLQRRMYEQLGLHVEIVPGFNEVRTMRGINITLGDLPGLCRKTRQSIPAAIRRGLEKRPEIAYELLNANDLLRDA
ncbi:ribosomal protein S3AE [Pseudomonas syringae]|uniref:Ribosomal protein S3AE n=1 Tax=Pseudomonas syringae TaxID=317 RepID=A0A0L1MF96_PSESX|nr:ribosomal protein S3AE [Pseudomonas syringae]